MSTPDNEDNLLRSVALQNAQSILLARQRAEQELLEAKEALRKSSEHLTSILESITEAFVVIDREWRFTYINRRAEEIIRQLQESRENPLGKLIWREFPELLGGGGSGLAYWCARRSWRSLAGESPVEVNPSRMPRNESCGRSGNAGSKRRQ